MAEQKTLYIVRHAKSSWGYENVSDMDRPLKNKGIRSAYEMAERLLKNNHQPDLIMSSPANRAIHTALIFAGVLRYPVNEIRIREELYGTHEQEIYNFIKNANDALYSIMIFGHNPDFTNLANLFLTEPVDYISTAGMVIISFNTDSWMKIERSNVKQVEIDAPKKG